MRARDGAEAVAMFDQNGHKDILNQMKGVVLATGIGTRFLPSTEKAKEKSTPRP